MCFGMVVRHRHSAGTMHKGMAPSTQRDQVLLGIITALAAKFRVVNLQIRSGPTALALPAVTAQYLFS